MICLAEGRDQ